MTQTTKMDLQAQLAMLIQAMPKERMKGHTFIACGRTFAMPDMRLAADRASREVGELLHTLLDAVEGSDLHGVQAQLKKEREQAQLLKDAIGFAQKNLKGVLERHEVSQVLRSADAKLLTDALEELSGALEP